MLSLAPCVNEQDVTPRHSVRVLAARPSEILRPAYATAWASRRASKPSAPPEKQPSILVRSRRRRVSVRSSMPVRQGMPSPASQWQERTPAVAVGVHTSLLDPKLLAPFVGQGREVRPACARYAVIADEGVH